MFKYNQDSLAQNISDISVKKSDKIKTSDVLEYNLEKIQSKGIEQVKIYLGAIYFAIVAFLTITLFL